MQLLAFPIFDGAIKHDWCHVHTVKLVFETCAQVTFEENLKEMFDSVNAPLDLGCEKIENM